MKTIVRAYTTKRQCSVEEAAYYIVSELHLGRVFPAVYFVNTNMPEDRSRILKWRGNWKIARQQQRHFQIYNIDQYLDWPNLSFCGGKYNVLNSFCFAEFAAHSVLYNSGEINPVDCEFQRDLLPDILSESNTDYQHAKIIELMNCTEKMKGHKIVHVLRYHVTNKHKFPGKYAHHLLSAHLFINFVHRASFFKLIRHIRSSWGINIILVYLILTGSGLNLLHIWLMRPAKTGMQNRFLTKM